MLDNWLAGRGCPDTLVIDGHVHTGPCRLPAHCMPFETMVQYMDVNGIDAICAVSGGYKYGSDFRKGNDYLLDLWSRLPDRVIPFMCFNPHDTKDSILSEVDRMYRAGVRCIKMINDYQEGYPGDGPSLMAVYEYASEHRMVILNHSWTEDVIMRISDEFREATFIF